MPLPSLRSHAHGRSAAARLTLSAKSSTQLGVMFGAMFGLTLCVAACVGDGSSSRAEAGASEQRADEAGASEAPEREQTQQDDDAAASAESRSPEAGTTRDESAPILSDAGSDPAPDAANDAAPASDEETEQPEAPEEPAEPVISAAPEGPCTYETWPGPDALLEQYQCVSLRFATWTCNCKGESIDAQILGDETCAEGLARVCEVEPTLPQYCQARGGAVCWAGGAADTWDCGCVPPDPETGELAELDPTQVLLGLNLTNVAGATCEASAFEHCAERCEDDWGSCEPVTDSQSYACACDYFGATREGVADSCRAALTQCDPTASPAAGSFGCRGRVGYCDIGLESIDCTCKGAGSHSLGYDDPRLPQDLRAPASLESVERVDAALCDDVLETLCGSEAEFVAARSCGATTSDGRECSITPDELGGLGCECAHTDRCAGPTNVRRLSLEDEACDAALARCTSADEAFIASAPETRPACAEPEGTDACSEIRGDRFCSAERISSVSFACTCSTPPDGADPFERNIDTADCARALTGCINDDAERRP